MIALLLSTALGGNYVFTMRAASDAKVPVLGWQHSVTETLALVELEDGRWAQTVCAVQVHDRTPLARTILPDAFVAAIPESVAEVTLDGDAIRVDLAVSRVGFLEGEMPTDPEDERIVDFDDDGRPGATVQIQILGFGTSGIDVLQIFQASLSGTKVGEGWEGQVQTVRLDQLVLGADHRMLASTPQLRSRDDKSSFSLVPTEAISCADLIATV